MYPNLILGDCLEKMKTIPDASVDLILCDPPYGTTACQWDKVIPFGKLWDEYRRVLKPDGTVVLFGFEPFSSKMRLSNLEMYKYDWKWEKDHGANFISARHQPIRVHEDIMVFSRLAASYSPRGSMRYNPQPLEGKPYKCKSGKQKTTHNNTSIRSPIESVVSESSGERLPRSVLRFKRVKHALHPTQKPVELLEYLIKTYTDTGDTVLDNCMGSGSTGVACCRTGRKFIGIELDPDYFNIAFDRIRTAVDGGEVNG